MLGLWYNDGVLREFSLVTRRRSSSQPPPSGRWALTQETLDRLLEFLGPDRSRASREYERLRQRLIRLFEWRGTASPEDLADQTLDRVARKLAEGLVIESDEPYRYFRGVADKVFHETLRSWERARSTHEMAFRDPSSPLAPKDPPAAEAAEVDLRRLHCLRQCLGRLPPQSRELILDYHGHDHDSRIKVRRSLAEKLEIQASALRLRVHRIRQSLEECTRACLEGGESGDLE